MQITLSVYDCVFYAAIGFTLFGAFLGLIGVWIRDFWNNDIAVKLILTDIIFAVTAIIVAAIMKWLGTTGTAAAAGMIMLL